MKAHIPVMARVSNKTKDTIREAVSHELEKEKTNMMRRFFKLAAISLNEQFGFGENRLLRFIATINTLSTKHEDDPVYWEHVDKRCDQLGLGLPHEDYEQIRGMK